MFVIHALKLTGLMGWQILWPLILGLTLSGAIQAVVNKRQMQKLLPDHSAKSLAKAGLLGAASSSCSYAAVALGRTIFRKGGDFIASVAFSIASTNLVVEMAVILLLLLGWQFTLAEFIAGPIMIMLAAILLAPLMKKPLLKIAFKQANRGLQGRMEGHAAMDDMSVSGNQGWLTKLLSPAGRTATSHYFMMDWASLWTDIILGLLIAGALAAWIPTHFWQTLFLSNHHVSSLLWGPVVAPFIAAVSSVCSVGNIPLAVVLWHSGISFGGVISFLFADLLILPIMRIYFKYYGWKTTLRLLTALYIAIVLTGYLISGIFVLLHITPAAPATTSSVSAFNLTWNYTTFLNIGMLVVGALLMLRFMRTNGPMMLKMMKQPPSDTHNQHHCH